MTGTVLLVEDGSGGSALQALRDLGPRGWRVVIASPAGTYAARSRWCAAHVALHGDLVDGVRQACVEHGVDVVLACGDRELLALSAARTALPARQPLPPHEVVLRAQDKGVLADLARRHGLAAPRSEPADGTQPPGFAGPALVKPVTRDGSPTAAATTWQPGPPQAQARAAALHRQGVRALYQQPVEGVLSALVVLVASDGEVRASLQQRADAVYPHGAGNCVRGRTVPVDEPLLSRVVALLAELGWTGLAQVEMVQPRTGGAPVVIDLNTRVYGSMALARAAGLGLADLLVRDALGQALPAPRAAVEGVTYQSREQDLRRALRTGGRDLLATLAVRADVHHVWDADDRAPAVAFAGQLARRALERAVPGRAA